MLNVNNDMDELLRRAAENYPLKTDDADFDKVLEGLKAEKAAEAVSVKRESRGRFLWFLFLLPLSFVCNRYVYPGNKTETKTQNIRKPVESPSSLQSDVAKKYADGRVKNREKDLNTSSIGKPANEKESSGFVPAIDVAVDDRGDSRSNHRKQVITDRTGIVSKRNSTFANNEKGGFSQLKNKPAQQDASVILDDLQLGANGLSADKGFNVYDPKTTGGNLMPKQKVDEVSTSTDKEKDEAQPNDKDNKGAVTGSSTKQHISLPDTTPKVIAVVKAMAEDAKAKRFYAGLVLGPDLSAVKSTNFSKLGVSAGVIAGYQFNKKLSIETGLLWDKKFYSSEGKYFDTKKLSIPSYVNIIELNGYCNMFELPIGIKYDFVQNKKATWFAVAGASTYFMKKESYNYSYLGYGILHNRTIDYTSSSTNWLSMLNLSVGYTHRIGKTGMLRIEPYLKIPLQRVGVGSLPISSTGLYAGFVKRIF